MKKTAILFVFILFASFSSLISQEKILSEKEKRQLVRSYYDMAIRYFAEKKYSKAISYYEEILKLDPEQTQAKKLIETCRYQIQLKLGGLLNEVKQLVSQGKYNSASMKLKEALVDEPENTELNERLKKVEQIKNIFGELTTKDKTAELVRKSVSEFCENPKGDVRLMMNSAIYASQISPDDVRIKKYLELLEKSYPAEYKAMEIIPGMNLVDQKLVSALNYIYDSKYDRAIVECNDVLALEPENILAYKRLGSAYYALKKEEEAKKIWRKALKLAPNDEELKMFIKQ